MGRTNLVILCFGIFACVALSLMMGHVVKLKDEKQVHPAVFEIAKVFGEDLRKRPKLTIKDKASSRLAVMEIVPKQAERTPRLARAIGRYLNRLRGQNLRFDKLEVVARMADDSTRVFPVRVTGGQDLVRRFATRGATPKKADTKKRAATKSGAAKRGPNGAKSTQKAKDAERSGAKPVPAKPPK